MKRLLALLLCAAMIFSMAACQRDLEEEEPEYTSSPETQPPEPEEYLKNAGEACGYDNAFSQLEEISSTKADGLRYTRFQQRFQKLPVYGRSVVCVTDKDGNVISVVGNAEDVKNAPEPEPGITTAQAQASIDAYFSDGTQIPDIGELSNDDLCIYDLSGESHLAYCLTAGNYEIVVDAHSGSVLSACETILSSFAAEGYAESDTSRSKPIDVERTSEGYLLKDPIRNIEVYNLHQLNSNNWDTYFADFDAYFSTVVSDDEVFGSEDDASADEAARMLYNTSRIYDFAAEMCDKTCNPPMIYAFIHDGFDDGENAKGGLWGDDGILFMGTVTGVEDVDTFAHEYGHIISRKAAKWKGGSVETAAIKEGFSDIFGALAEAWYYGWEDPDWVIEGDNITVRRNLANPEDTGNAAELTDAPAASRGGYYYSTLISHTAYLMYQEGMAAEEILQIWYHALLMMPSDCGFYECRELLELAAGNLGYSKAWLDTIGGAFDAVGIITPDIPNYEISANGTLNVLDFCDEAYDDYILKFWRLRGDVVGMNPGLYPMSAGTSEIAIVTTDDPWQIPFDDGVFLVELTDNGDPAVTKQIYLTITPEGSSHLDISTQFGMVTLDKLMPHLQLYWNCACMYYGVEPDTSVTYRRVFADVEDSYYGDFVRLVPWDEISAAESHDALELPVYKSANFHSPEEVDTYLLQYFTSELLENKFREMMGYRLAMYEGELYWIGHNMGDPMAMYYDTAELNITSGKVCTVTIARGYAGYHDETSIFTFNKLDGRWMLADVTSA